MKILLFGPITPPNNGQAIAFTVVTKQFSLEEVVVINTAKYNSRILNTLHSFFQTIYVFLTQEFSTVYFTSSRSTLGFIKDLPLLVLGKLGKKRLINHLHGADFKFFFNNSGILKPLIQWSYDGVDTSIVLLEGMKKEYKSFRRMKTIAIANSFSKDLNKDIEWNNKKEQILFLSNLLKSKGILEFLDACEILLARYEMLQIKIAGSPLGDNLLNTRSISSLFNKKYNFLNHRYGDRIEYLGNVEGEEKRRLLMESSIFVLPTYYSTEAFPISILEAMGSGNAIITTNHNYLSEIVKSENGIVIEPKSVQGIIHAVERLLDEPAMLQKIQKYNVLEAREKYSEEEYVKRVMDVIKIK